MLKGFSGRVCAAAMLLATSFGAHATFHLWQINEIYSNADGSVQFIELITTYGGQQFVAGHTLTSSQGATTHTLNITTDLPGDSAYKTFLIGTQGFAALNVVAPDYVVPNGFLFTDGGTLNWGGGADVVSYASLPTDGRLSINRVGATAINSPTNFAGVTGTITIKKMHFDFDGDGKDDVLRRNSATGENYIYFMNGTAILTAGDLRQWADLNWNVAGVGDFDGDGKADILWRNSATGENYIFFMNGTAILATEGYIRTMADQNWQVAGIGDFDGDGKDDILWRNALTGENYLFPMNGLVIKATEGYIRTMADQDWQVVGIGDFDGDGKADILWRNAFTGQNYLYPMNGTTILGTEGYIKTVSDRNWRVAGVGDFDGDGKADILWRNFATGKNYIDLMNGTAILTEGSLRTVADLNWQIQALGDYNGDGKADILWRNSATGDNYLYPMSGITILGTEGFVTAPPLAVTTPGLPPLPRTLWSAGMETGDLSEWSGMDNSGSAQSVAVTASSAGIPAKTGNWVMQQSVTGSVGGTRMNDSGGINALSQAGTTFYVSWWDYFPAQITFGEADMFSIFQIASRDSDGVYSPIWGLDFQPSGPDFPPSNFALTLIWSPDNMAPPGPHADESGKRYYYSTQLVPVGQWMFFEVMITPSSDFTGAVKIWMNGAVLFDLTAVKTRFPDVGAGGFMYTTQNAYGSGLTPTPATHYVDNATVSLGRMPSAP